MIHIGICDDEEYTRSYIRRLIGQQDERYRITEFSSGMELLDYIGGEGATDIDILFLDIAMDGPDGMETARNFRKIQSQNGRSVWGSLPLIIFVTGYSDYMPQAFGVNAFGFVVKPVAEAEFYGVLKRACEECRHIATQVKNGPKLLTIKNSAARRTVSSDEIYYIESMGHKVQLHLENDVIELNAKIGDMESELVPDFFRIHRGYLVNMKYIDGYDPTRAIMKNGDTVYISKYKFSDFTKAYMQFISGRSTVIY